MAPERRGFVDFVFICKFCFCFHFDAFGELDESVLWGACASKQSDLNLIFFFQIFVIFQNLIFWL